MAQIFNITNQTADVSARNLTLSYVPKTGFIIATAEIRGQDLNVADANFPKLKLTNAGGSVVYKEVQMEQGKALNVHRYVVVKLQYDPKDDFALKEHTGVGMKVSVADATGNISKTLSKSINMDLSPHISIKQPLTDGLQMGLNLFNLEFQFEQGYEQKVRPVVTWGDKPSFVGATDQDIRKYIVENVEYSMPTDGSGNTTDIIIPGNTLMGDSEITMNSDALIGRFDGFRDDVAVSGTEGKKLYYKINCNCSRV
jgi:hypothetical protein